MTTVTATKQMIYSDRNVAQMLLGKLQKREPEAKWALTKLPQGYQLSRVTVLPAQQIKPLPYENKAAKMNPDKFADFASMYGASDEKVAKIMGLDMAHMEQKAVVAENNVSSFVKAVTGELDAWEADLSQKAGSAKKIGSHVDMTAPFEKETKSWIYFAAPVGPEKKLYLHKNHVTSYKVENGMVSFAIPKAKAKDQGLIG